MYTLFNQELKRFLKHPKHGIWASENLAEANEILESAKQYVKSIGIPELADKLTVVEINIDEIH